MKDYFQFHVDFKDDAWMPSNRTKYENLGILETHSRRNRMHLASRFQRMTRSLLFLLSYTTTAGLVTTRQLYPCLILKCCRTAQHYFVFYVISKYDC